MESKESKFNTSFIPKKSLQADTGSGGHLKYTHNRTIYGPGFFLMLLVFIITLAASFGIFGYTKIVIRNIEEKIAKMEEQKASFDINSINMLTNFDLRIRSAQKLLASHVAVSGMFDLLEKITLKRVQYMELEYEGLPNDSIALTITGISDNFKNIALQTAQYRKNKDLLNPVVNDLEKKADGNVDFSVDMEVDSHLVDFSSVLNSLESAYSDDFDAEDVSSDAGVVNEGEELDINNDDLIEDF